MERRGRNGSDRRCGAAVRCRIIEAPHLSRGDPVSTDTIDIPAVKSRQQTAWAAGDYAVIATTLQIVGESLCEAVDVQAGERVLDVAAGNGNASLAAARRGAEVTATDYVGSLLDGTRARAAANGLTI